MLMDTAPVDFDYGSQGVTGWSYYNRVFNLKREQSVAEMGWGQWTKPKSTKDFNEVCTGAPFPSTTRRCRIYAWC